MSGEEQVMEFHLLQASKSPPSLLYKKSGKMNKEETIAKYGEAAWQKKLERDRAYYKANKEQKKAYNKRYNEEHPDETKARSKEYREEHPEKRIANSQEQNRKGGKYYEKNLAYIQTGIPGEKQKIRMKHNKQYSPYKNIIAPDSQIHHEWVPTTSEYRGVALVEADTHMHGFVDVIEILDGKITLLTEEEVRKGKKRIEEADEMIEKIDEETKLVYSYEDGGYFFMKRRWKVTATVYKTRGEAIAAYRKEQEEIEADRKELGAR